MYPKSDSSATASIYRMSLLYFPSDNIKSCVTYAKKTSDPYILHFRLVFFEAHLVFFLRGTDSNGAFLHRWCSDLTYNIKDTGRKVDCSASGPLGLLTSLVSFRLSH